MIGQNTDLLTNYEIEMFVQEIKIIEIEEYGSPEWFKQDEIIQKLNMQIHINALIRAEQFIMENFVTFDKVKPLIYDLLVSETWKSNVFPLLKDKICELNSYRSYFSLYHEACVCNLLEIMFFHRTAVESAENYLLEVIDYCYRKIMFLLKSVNKEKVKKKTIEDYIKKSALEDLEDQKSDIEFSIGMMCISILRFISDYVRYLPLNISHHLLVDNDIFCVLVPLIEDKPYLRVNSNDEREIFENSKWNLVPKNEYGKLPKLEANLWITIYNLFMDPDCRSKYELNDFRKSNLLRLRKFLNEVLLDQLPVLSPMMRSLEELNLMNVRSQTLHNSFIIQQMPELKLHIMKGKDWKKISEYQLNNYFKQDANSMKEDMKKLAELYSQSSIEGLLEGFHCQKCQKDAMKRCSKCKSVWYCSKDCQVADWKDHKKNCVSKTNNIINEKNADNNINKINEINTDNNEIKTKIIQDLSESNKELNNKIENKENKGVNKLDDLD